jgi:hypothetical protein
VPELSEDRPHAAVCWKKHGKPTGAKFGGKGKPGGREKGVAFTAHEETWDGAWILELGCTQHLTGNKGMFKTLEAVGSRKEIEFGNQQSLAAEGGGEVELRCVTPDGEHVVTLKEVYYIPGVAVNLFLVRRATEKGAEVYLSKERCSVKYEGERRPPTLRRKGSSIKRRQVFPGAKRSGGKVEPGAHGAGTGDAH